MSHGKLKIPNSLIHQVSGGSESLQKEMLKTERASIESGAKMEVARLQVANEAIKATQAFFSVLKSYNELQATRVEWEGRVLAAESSVRQAQLSLAAAQVKNEPLHEQLRQSEEAQNRILELFDQVMAELKTADLSEEGKVASREYLLELSDKLVKLKG